MLLAARAEALEGHYVGGYTYTDEGGASFRMMQHRYNAGARRSFTETLGGEFHVALNYRTRPGESDTELLQSRMLGDLRGSGWRLFGQFAPWQDKTPGVDPPRERYRQVGLEWTVPALGPHLAASWEGRDGDSDFGRSAFEDKRLRLSDAIGPIAWDAQWRRLDSRRVAPSSSRTETEEWRGELATTRAWDRATWQAGWEGINSDLRIGESRQRTVTHRLHTEGTWRPARTVSLSATALGRFGESDLTGAATRDIDERAYGAGATWRPWTSLDLELTRDYRRTAFTSEGGDRISDYVRFRSRFQQRVFRESMFQSGFEQTFDRRDEAGVPRNSAWARVDGPIREGLAGRAELRVSGSAGSVSTGRQWRRLLQLRATPTRESRLEVTWQKEDLPEVAGVGQDEREWRIVGGLDPSASTTFTTTVVRRDGRGRIPRTERLASFAATWRPGPRSSIGFDGSVRESTVLGAETSENVIGTEVTTWLPGEYRLVGSARRSTTGGDAVRRIFSMSVEKAFR
jgi:hypothetical protein